MPDTIRVTAEADVHRVTLDRPERRNAMNAHMVDDLIAALDHAEAANARLIVLRGAGDHFCAGGDVADMATARNDAGKGEPDAIASLSARFGDLALRWSRTEVPVLCVVHGAVMGGGFGLACTADLVLASNTTVFRLPETSLGLVPAQIAPFLLERLGYSEAKRLALTGSRVDAATALGLGLVHRVVEPDTLEDEVHAATRRILRGAPSANRATKALLHRLHAGIQSADIHHAATVFARAARSTEASEGMAAFLSKEDPSWVT